jgi:hypothetical protein
VNRTAEMRVHETAKMKVNPGFITFLDPSVPLRLISCICSGGTKC